MKLLATRIVANNFLGRSNNLAIKLPLLKSSAVKSSIFFCESEKRATSVPETKAEQNSNNTTITRFTSNSKSIL
jgi:hypothetical protein